VVGTAAEEEEQEEEALQWEVVVAVMELILGVEVLHIPEMKTDIYESSKGERKAVLLYAAE
jgi:hypothetical protein